MRERALALGPMGASTKRIVTLLLPVAREILREAERHDDRPGMALNELERWTRGEATLAHLREARADIAEGRVLNYPDPWARYENAARAVESLLDLVEGRGEKAGAVEVFLDLAGKQFEAEGEPPQAAASKVDAALEHALENIIDPWVARSLLDYAQSMNLRGRLTARQAEGVVAYWLTALRGLTRDRWGNYIVEAGKVRYHFTGQRLQKQRYSYGAWRNAESDSLIDKAQILLANAAVALGDEEAEKVRVGARKARKEGRARAAGRRSAKERRVEAEVLASKRVAWEHPEEVRTALEGSRPTDEVAARINAEIAEHVRAYETMLAQGIAIDDGSFASASRPPFVPLYRKVRYDWIEKEGGVEYTVSIVGREKGQASLQIGRTGPFALGADAWSGSLVPDVKRLDAKGDGYISARLSLLEGAPVAVLYLIMGQKPWAGVRLMNLWCRLMRGYGVRRWAGEGLNDTAWRFVKALAKRGSVEILARRESSVLVRCTGK